MIAREIKGLDFIVRLEPVGDLYFVTLAIEGRKPIIMKFNNPTQATAAFCAYKQDLIEKGELS